MSLKWRLVDDVDVRLAVSTAMDFHMMLKIQKTGTLDDILWLKITLMNPDWCKLLLVRRKIVQPLSLEGDKKLSLYAVGLMRFAF